MAITDLTASELLLKLTSRDVSAVDVCQAYLERMQAIDDVVGGFLRVDAEDVRAQARAIDRRRAAGAELGPLAGLPVAVKDVLCTRGQLTTCASKMLADFRPPYDATVISRLRAADAIVLGKTNLDEFAMGGSTEASALGVTRNPWDPNCVPGGSSGGSAAAVAARLAPVAIGTDTGGSIRQPASFCGVVGLKPTYGRVSRFGLVAFASSLDQIGPMATTVRDAALLLEAIAGHDSRDATSAPMDVPAYTQSLGVPLRGLRLGRVREHFGEGLDPEVEAAVDAAIDVYRGLGSTVVDVSMPHSRYGIATYYIIAPSEASSNLARYDGVHYGHRTDAEEMMTQLEQAAAAARQSGDEAALESLDSPLVRMYRRTRAEGFGPEVKRRIMLGTYALSAGYYDAYYLKALKVRRLIRQDFDEAFAQVDFLIGPVAPTPAFELGERIADPLAMYLGDLYTVLANLAGVAGISIPCGFSAAGLPIGLQLQARPFDEERLLQAADMFQQATDWHTRRPKL